MRGTYTYGGVGRHLLLSPRSKCTSPAETGYGSPRSMHVIRSLRGGTSFVLLDWRDMRCAKRAPRRGASYFETGVSYFGLRDACDFVIIEGRIIGFDIGV
jgi:hypothetical protein